MPILRIDLGSPTPVYRQIVDSLRALLVGGAFAPVDRMSLYVRVHGLEAARTDTDRNLVFRAPA
jgi:hypothetical protein